jgi:hypothetical protein
MGQVIDDDDDEEEEEEDTCTGFAVTNVIVQKGKSSSLWLKPL